MLTLHVDSEKLDRLLQAKNISSRMLSKHLRVLKAPTRRTINGWLGGEEVAPRWRQSIVDHFGLGLELFDSDGCFLKNVGHFGVSADRLSRIKIYDSITPSAISEWRNGGGIEPDTLIALAGFLEVAPADLLDSETLIYLSILTGIGFDRK